MGKTEEGSIFLHPTCVQQEEKIMFALTALFIILALYVILVLVLLVHKQNSAFGHARDGQHGNRLRATA